MSKTTTPKTEPLQDLAQQAAGAAREGLMELSETLPSALEQAAAQAQAMARRGIERARQAGSAVGESCTRAGERTVDRIREEPVKAVLIAAAAGAAVALLAGWAARQRQSRG